MKTKTIILFLWISVILNILFASTFLFYWISSPGCGKHVKSEITDYKKNEKAEMALNLDSAQKVKFAEQKKAHKDKIQPLIDNIKASKNKMFNEFRNDKPDTVLISREIKTILDNEEKVHREMVRHILLVKPILNKDQFSKFINRFENIMHCQRDSGMHKKWGKTPHDCCNNQ